MILTTKNEGTITCPKHVPKSAYENALKGLEKFNQDEEKRRAQLNEQIRELNKKMEASMINLLGKEKYSKWMAYKAEIQAESLKWPVSKTLPKEFSVRDRMEEFFKENKMPVDQMRKLVDSRHETYTKIMKEYHGPSGEKKGEKEVDMESVVPKSNTCAPVQYRYPWYWWQQGFNADVNGYQVTPQGQVNGQTGLISAEINAVITNGDDSDHAHAVKHTQHGAWVHSGQGGYLTAYILAESLVDKHEIHAFDEEWQWSRMYCHTQNDIMFHVVHPNVTGWGRAEMSEFRLSLNDDGHYHHYDRSFLDHGSHHWAIINSRGPVPANEWVFVRFGSSLSLDVDSDDYKVNATVKAAWNIKTIFILCNGS